jgi:hypothetical protein
MRKAILFLFLVFSLPLLPNILIGQQEPGQSGAETPKQFDLKKEYLSKKKEIATAEKESGKFDSETRLRLAIWAVQTNEELMRNTVISDLQEIVRKEPDNVFAHQMLGHVKYQNKWMTMQEYAKVREKECEKILQKMKTTKDSDKGDLIKSFKEIEIPCKMKPLVNTLLDSSESMKLFAISELKDTKEKSAIPYLVRASLIDEKESVRKASFDTVKDWDRKESNTYYSYYSRTAGNAFDGQLRGRALQSIIDSGVSEIDSDVVGSVMWTMHGLMCEIKAQLVTANAPFTLPNLRTASVNFTNPTFPPYGGTVAPISLMGSYNIELPDVSFQGIHTRVKMPASGSISLERQLFLAGRALEAMTAQNFGTDYNKWLAWWQDYNKSLKKPG